ASGRCLALITPDAERTMCTYLGAASQLSQADLDPDLLARTDLLYVEGYLWDLAETIEALRSAMSEAKAAGAKVAFSLSDAFCVERHRDEFLELMDSDLDLVFANEAEVLLLYGTDDFDQTVKRLAGSGLTAALTRGPGGSVVVSEGEVLAVDAHPVDKVVDTTGAGDLYAAGFLFGMSRARSWTDCAQLGSLAAAEVISHVGARPEADLVALAQDQGLI
ncbi:MAG: adenosine kinase, partial [Acidimicrobiales bacterium]